MAKRQGQEQARKREFLAIVRAVKQNKARFIRRLQRLVYNDGNCVRFLGAHTKDGYGRMTLHLPVRSGTQMKMAKISAYAHRVFLVLKLARPIKMQHDAGHELGCPHRDCVLHVFEQHFALNCNTNGKGDPVLDCPF